MPVYIIVIHVIRLTRLENMSFFFFLEYRVHARLKYVTEYYTNTIHNFKTVVFFFAQIHVVRAIILYSRRMRVLFINSFRKRQNSN